MMPDKPLTLSATRAPEPAIAHSAAAGRRLAPAGSGASPPAARAAAFSEFEAFLLQHTLESVLPKDATLAYGKGLAGQMWRSMLAEKLAVELARSGRFGIASTLAAAQSAGAAGPTAPGTAATPAPSAMPSAGAGTEAGWSTAVVAENPAQGDAAISAALQTGVIEP
jgi:Rod binding domain-containing protein